MAVSNINEKKEKLVKIVDDYVNYIVRPYTAFFSEPEMPYFMNFFLQLPALIASSRFKIVPANSPIATAASDGENIYFNERFLDSILDLDNVDFSEMKVTDKESLSPKEIKAFASLHVFVGIVFHELLHELLKHSEVKKALGVRTENDQIRFNLAADVYINELLNQERKFLREQLSRRIQKLAGLTIKNPYALPDFFAPTPYYYQERLKEAKTKKKDDESKGQVKDLLVPEYEEEYFENITPSGIDRTLLKAIEETAQKLGITVDKTADDFSVLEQNESEIYEEIKKVAETLEEMNKLRTTFKSLSGEGEGVSNQNQGNGGGGRRDTQENEGAGNKREQEGSVSEGQGTGRRNQKDQKEDTGTGTGGGGNGSEEQENPESQGSSKTQKEKKRGKDQEGEKGAGGSSDEKDKDKKSERKENKGNQEKNQENENAQDQQEEGDDLKIAKVEVGDKEFDVVVDLEKIKNNREKEEKGEENDVRNSTSNNSSTSPNSAMRELIKDILVRELANKTKGTGTIDIAELIKTLYAPTNEWKRVLEKFKKDVIKAQVKKTWTRLREGREYYANKWGILFKGTKQTRKDGIFFYFVVDTSASMSSEEYKMAKSLLLGALIEGKVSGIIEIQHTDEITNVIFYDKHGVYKGEIVDGKLVKTPQRIDPNETIARTAMGGTSHYEVFKLLEKNVKPGDGIVFVTDFESDVENISPKFRFLKVGKPFWLITTPGGYERARRVGSKIGTVALIDSFVNRYKLMIAEKAVRKGLKQLSKVKV